MPYMGEPIDEGTQANGVALVVVCVNESLKVLWRAGNASKRALDNEMRFLLRYVYNPLRTYIHCRYVSFIP